MKIHKRLFILAALSAFVISCNKEEPEVPHFKPIEEEDEPEVVLPEPKPCSNNVVAHRGGAAEAGKAVCPDNSIAALKYTMGLGCYAMECDILWTSDDRVIVCHPDGNGKVNNMHPSQHTLAEIRNAGRLSNGEQVPTLEEFLDVLMTNKDCCTKLWIETKNITSSDLSGSQQETAIQNGFLKAMEIIKEKNAQKFVEFNGTGRSAVFKKIYPKAVAEGYEMSYACSIATSASTMKANNWAWANADVSTGSASDIAAFIDSYDKAGVALSIYNLDTDALRKAAIPYKDKLKGMLTNYPAALLKALK